MRIVYSRGLSKHGPESFCLFVAAGRGFVAGRGLRRGRQTSCGGGPGRAGDRRRGAMREKPRNLPFLALHDAVSTFAGKAYVAFSESDLTWRFASCDLGVPSVSASPSSDSCPSDEVVDRVERPRCSTQDGSRKRRAAASRPLIGPDAPPLAQALRLDGRKGRRVRLAADGPEPLFATSWGADGRRGAHAGVSTYLVL